MTNIGLRFGPGEAERAVVERLAAAPGQAPRDLVRALDMPRASVARVLTKLVAAGRAEKDCYARYSLVEPTETAR